MSMTRFSALILISCLLLNGCSTAKNIGRSLTGAEKAEKTQKKKAVSLNLAQKSYNEAFKNMSKGRYEKALEEYNSLIIQYPFGQITEQAKLDSIFVLHKLEQTEDAKRVVDRFIEQYPTHENIDYAYYMKGIILFPKKKGTLSRTFGTSALRDASDLLAAHSAFKAFVEKFPESTQVADAKQRMIFLDNAVAQDELSVAEFYLTKNAYVAVINRCQYIIENYSRTPSARDALLLMRDTYKTMGLSELAQNTQAVINANNADAEVQTRRKKNKRFSFPTLKFPSFLKKNKT